LFYLKFSILKARNCIFQGRLQFCPSILYSVDEFLPHVIMGGIEIFYFGVCGDDMLFNFFNMSVVSCLSIVIKILSLGLELGEFDLN
jgi:hypothetical protein